MSIKNKIADSDSVFFLPVKFIFYRYYNKYYEVNNIIKSCRLNDDGNILVELNSGIKLTSAPSKYTADKNFTERYKYGIKSKMTKIIDVDRFYFLYEILSELFLYNQYFNYTNLKEGDIVIDAGANIGGFVVQAAQKVGKTGKIIAIEPDEENRKILQKNLDLNEIKNCEIIPNALWSEKCTKEFFISHRPGEHTLINYENDSHFIKKNVTTIYCERLDDIINNLNIKNVDYLKMDIEGAEIEALKGAEDFLKNQNPFLLIEALHSVNGEPAYKTLIPYLESFGYKMLREVEQKRGTIMARK